MTLYDWNSHKNIDVDQLLGLKLVNVLFDTAFFTLKRGNHVAEFRFRIGDAVMAGILSENFVIPEITLGEGDGI